MGNSGNREFLPLLSKLSHDEDAVVAEHARWAESKLRTADLELETDISPTSSGDAK